MTRPSINIKLTSPKVNDRLLISPIDEFLLQQLTFNELNELTSYRFETPPQTPRRINRKSSMVFEDSVSIVLIFALDANNEISRHEFGISANTSTARASGIESVTSTLDELMPTVNRLVIIVSSSTAKQNYVGSRAHLFEVMDRIPPILVKLLKG